MLLPLLFAASMLMVSDRANFWDDDKVAPHTQFGEVTDQGITKLLDPSEVQRFAGKRVLILVHGFATPEACYPYFTVQANMLDDGSPYDAIIGYIWPCYTNHLAYLQAKSHADLVAPRLKILLKLLQPVASCIDVAAHSLGNRLVLKALDFTENTPVLIHNFLSIAPAVDNESIEMGEEFFDSTKHCSNLYIFFSQRDDVLRWAYFASEWDKALGYDGAEHPKKIPQNVQMVDCTSIIDSHDGYLFSKPIFSFIQQAAWMLPSELAMARNLFFTPDGMFQALHSESMR
jgi:esterase/lipase superfamily enzyme